MAYFIKGWRLTVSSWQFLSVIKIICVTIFSVISFSALSQNSSREITLLEKTSFIDPQYEKKKIKFMQTKSKNILVRYNPVTLGLGGLMFFYQKVISGQLGANCPYEISCSNFSKQAIREFGLVKGAFLSADRLTRCTQFTVIDILPLNISKDRKIVDSLSDYRFKRKK